MTTMEENNFEKRVRQEMSDLKIDPSDAVWENVKSRIEKKKSRRRGFLIFFLLGALLLGSGYFMLYSPQHIKTSETIFNNDLKKEVVEEPEKSKIDAAKTVPQKTDISGGRNIATIPGDKVTSVKKIDLQEENTDNNIIDKTAAGDDDNIIKKVLSKNNVINEEKDIEVIAATSKPQDILQQDEKKNVHDFKKPGIDITVINNNVAIDTGKIITLVDPVIINDTGVIKANNKPNDSLTVLTKANKASKSVPKKQWHVGLNLTGGISYVGNNFLSANKSVALDYVGSLPNSNPGNGYYNSMPPSEVKPSGAFGIGLFVQKDLSAKTSFSAGLNYLNLAVSNLEGDIYDSIQVRYSRSAKKSYRNNFNFIEMPLEVKARLGKGKKMPVYFHGGISISTLINSNALQYKADSTGRYYKNNGLLNKMQFGLNTGLSINLFNIKKSPVTIGPYLYYGISGVAKEGLYNKQHFIFTGLRTQILFKRK